MTVRRLDILLIEDDNDYANLIRRLIHETDAFKGEIIHHQTLTSGLVYLQNGGSVDIVLLDLILPDSDDSFQTFARVRKYTEHLPVIVLTGIEESAQAKNLVQSGAQDYLSKAHLSVKTLTGAINHARERHAKIMVLRQKANDASESEQRLSKLINASSDGMLVLDSNGQIIFANPAMRIMLGRDDDDTLIGMEFGYPIATESPTEIDILRANGKHALAEMRLVKIDWEDVNGYLATFRDITEREQTATELRRINARFRSLVYSSPDTHLGITYPERELTLYRDEFLGHSKQSIENDDALFDATHPDDREILHKHHADIAATTANTVITTEYRVYSRAGKLEWVQARGAVSQRDDDGTTREILINMSIITIRKQADQRLMESERRFRVMADQAPVMIWMTGIDPADDYFNRAWTELTGRSIETESDGGWIEGVHPQDREAVRAAYAAAIETHRLFDTEFRLRRADGDYAWVLSHGVPRRGPEGEFAGFIGSTVDITQRKEADAETLELAVKRRQIEVTQQFIESATHEFRTPLSIINSNVYLTQRVKDAKRQRRYLEEIHGQVEAISQLIDDLVTMLNLDGMHKFSVETLHINVLVRTALTQSEGRIMAKQLNLQQVLAEELPVIEGSRRYLGTAIYRLIDNAIRYTSTGDTITLRSSATSDGGVILEVIDTGIGMGPEEVSQAFNAFYRKDAAHSTRGFGLGLAIVQRTVMLHNGQVEVNSTPGVGSTFTLRLPPKPSNTVIP